MPKALLFGQLDKGKRSVGRPTLRYKDTLKYNLKECGICPDAWEKRLLKSAQGGLVFTVKE